MDDGGADDEDAKGPEASGVSAFTPVGGVDLVWTLDERLSLLGYGTAFVEGALKGGKPMVALQLLVGPSSGGGAVATAAPVVRRNVFSCAIIKALVPLRSCYLQGLRPSRLSTTFSTLLRCASG